VCAEGGNRKRPLQALSTLDEDANSLLMSAIGEEAETEQPSSKSARHSAAAGGVGGACAQWRPEHVRHSTAQQQLLDSARVSLSRCRFGWPK
jgi:hypothetical protein